MKLFDYLMMFKEDVVFDVPDTKIDNVVTVYFIKENAEKIAEHCGGSFKTYKR